MKLKRTASQENNEVDQPKKTHPGFRDNLCDYFTEYSNYTGIHGLKYIGEQKRSLFEKFCWLIIVIVSLSICIHLIIKTYEKWDTSPVIVSFAKSPTPVWEIPFPAITICSETKSRRSVFNYTEIYHKELANNLTNYELKRFEEISLVCDSHLHPEGNKTIDESTMDFLRKVSPPFSEIFFECKWTNKPIPCKDLFVPMLTEEGICFSFNMLDRKELFTRDMYTYGKYFSHGRKSTNWTLEKGYPKDVGKDTFPQRAISAGQTAGLSVLMRAYEKDLDYICRGPVQGFKILLHHPAEIPRVSQQYFRAPLNQEIVVAIKPDMMTTSEGLKNYEPHNRQCYFPTERQLKFYQVYTQQNCQVECLTNFSLATCGCVSYHMPHDENTPLCGPGSTLCLHRAQIELLAQEVESNLKTDTEDSEDVKRGIGECDCLPACTSLSYNAENSQADFNWPRYFQANKTDFNRLTGAKLTRVTFFFKEMQFITSERNELYGPTDFMANCGGLLGLFMGFSVLSFVEILYFLSLRVYCNVRQYGEHFWSGSEDLLANDAYEHKH